MNVNKQLLSSEVGLKLVIIIIYVMPENIDL